MSKNSNILIIGFGSIGQRHYQNLRKLGLSNVSVYDTDKQRTKKSGLKVVKNISLSTLKQFDIVFICNPSHFHIQTALRCVEAGCHVFIEKPLSHNLKDIGKLQKISARKKRIVMVACNMRFHPCLLFIKEYLETKKLGKVFGIRHKFGYYLPYWRPGEDYRKNYAAKRSTGGGIILDDIHEFDLLFWLNNNQKIVQSSFLFDKVSDLEIETEDICIAFFQFKNNVFGSVMCDYLSKSYKRTCNVMAEKGNLEWDFNENIVWLKKDESAKKLFAVKDYNVNSMYLKEIKYFLDCVDKKRATFNDITTAYRVLEYCIKR